MHHGSLLERQVKSPGPSVHIEGLNLFSTVYSREAGCPAFTVAHRPCSWAHASSVRASELSEGDVFGNRGQAGASDTGEGENGPAWILWPPLPRSSGQAQQLRGVQLSDGRRVGNSGVEVWALSLFEQGENFGDKLIGLGGRLAMRLILLDGHAKLSRPCKSDPMRHTALQ